MHYRFFSRLWTPAFLLLLFSCGGEPAALRFNPPAGQAIGYDFEFDIRQQYLDQPANSALRVGLSMVCTGEEDGLKVLKVSYTRFALKMEPAAPAGNIDADTDQPVPDAAAISADPARMPARIFHAMKGQDFTLKLNQLGEIVAVTGMDSIVERVAASIVTDLALPATQLEEIRAIASAQFNEAALKDMLQPFFHIYPGRPVKTGDSWSRSMQLRQGLPLSVSTVYTVKARDEQTVTLEASSDLASSAQQRGSTLTGTQTNLMVLDAATGLLKKASIRQELKGTLNNAPVSMSSEGTVTRQ